MKLYSKSIEKAKDQKNQGLGDKEWHLFSNDELFKILKT